MSATAQQRLTRRLRYRVCYTAKITGPGTADFYTLREAKRFAAAIAREACFYGEAATLHRIDGELFGVRCIASPAFAGAYSYGANHAAEYVPFVGADL